MEMKVEAAAVVTARRAPAASGSNQGSADRLLSAKHGLSHAPLATPPWILPAVQRELDDAMPVAAPQFDRLRPLEPGRPALPPQWRV